MQEFSIVEKLNDLQIEQLHQLLQKMWWSTGRTMEDVLLMFETSQSFGLIRKDNLQLVGYARVLSDKIKFAYIYDVMTDEAYRGRGLGKMIINNIMTHPNFSKVKHFELTCAPDMVDFYKKFGFSEDYGNGVKPMRASRQK